MTGYILSPAAQADVDGIWDYTAEKWGVDQAESYTQDIGDACRELAVGSRSSRPVDIRSGYRKALVGLHVLFFKTEDTGRIVIMRVLHQSMDAGRHM